MHQKPHEDTRHMRTQTIYFLFKNRHSEPHSPVTVKESKPVAVLSPPKPCCLHQSQSSKTFVVRRVHGSKSQVSKASCRMQSELLEHDHNTTHMSEASGHTHKSTRPFSIISCDGANTQQTHNRHMHTRFCFFLQR